MVSKIIFDLKKKEIVKKNFKKDLNLKKYNSKT